RQRFTRGQLVRALLTLARGLYATGDWDEAMAQARVARSLVIDEGRVWTAGQPEATLAVVLAARGDWNIAEQHLDTARQPSTARRTPEIALVVRFAESSLARAREDPAGGVAAFGPLVRPDGLRPAAAAPMLAWWPALVVAMIDLGDVAGATDHVSRLEVEAA